MANPWADPSALVQPDQLGRLDALLRAAKYRTERLPGLLELDLEPEAVLSDIGRQSLYHLGRLSRNPDPAAVLFELFLFCGQVTEARWHRLEPELTDLLTELGLVQLLPAAQRRGTVAITEIEDKFFLSDRLFEHRPREFTRDWPIGGCMPPHASSISLRRSVAEVDRPGQSFLDMGCGTGCQSQLAGADQGLRVGVDISPRSVAFATANAILNGVEAQYRVGDCTSYVDSVRYSRIAFNAPGSATAFAFINTTLPELLNPDGVAQVWFDVEITARDGSLAALLRRVLVDHQHWQLHAETDSSSPFALSPECVRERRLPQNSLLADGYVDRDTYHDALAARQVIEVQSVVLTLRVAQPAR